MSKDNSGPKVFSLLQVTKSIQKTIADRYGSAFWVRAEMNKLNRYQHSGHCYPELVEKKDGKIIAQMDSILWKSDYDRINARFQQVLKEPLKDGIKILFLATVNYNSKYGLSLQIVDIDPSFTLGDLHKEKQQTLKRLQAEGLFDKNKSLALPPLPKRIAIISVETSKGFADFVNVLNSATESFGYSFFHMLFPSLLQGDKAVETLIAQLRRVRKVARHFDVVALVRGGGGDIGLSCYNHYDLAREIAEFPIPVITGIGHATNETISELIAYENAITPTKLAEFLIQKSHDFAVPLHKAEERIVDRCQRLITEEKKRFADEIKLMQSVTRHLLLKNRNIMGYQSRLLSDLSRFRIGNEKRFLTVALTSIKRETHQLCTTEKQNVSQLALEVKKDVASQIAQSGLLLMNLSRNLENLSPKNVLKRGYSITQRNGKSLRSSDQVHDGDALTTVLFEGEITSIVTDIESKNPS